MRVTLRATLAVLLIATSASALFAQEKKATEPKKADTKAPAKAKAPPPRMAPTVANYKYGTDSERQVFDFFQAKSDRPTPLVLLIHGGGWKGGDKTGYGDSTIKPSPSRRSTIGSSIRRWNRKSRRQ